MVELRELLDVSLREPFFCTNEARPLLGAKTVILLFADGTLQGAG